MCEIPVIQNGTVTHQTDSANSWVYPWDKITVTCDEGFEISAAGQLLCLNTNGGRYDLPIPTCKKLSNECNTPYIANGTINGPIVRALFRVFIELHSPYAVTCDIIYSFNLSTKNNCYLYYLSPCTQMSGSLLNVTKGSS